ncbi:hypothetical protein ACSDQ9_09670 [Aestuariimicrobium soli]|uniref:hypothetical protein n=1 Tax=Aestuariimicrobium soli TaxID=2035834 RepID=UPI003EBE1E25
MGTGIIVSIIVIAGLAYLIPWFAARRTEGAQEEEPEAFAESMTLIRRAGVLVDEHADECEVSTPMTRRAALYEVNQSHRAAAIRRRRVTLTLVALTVVTAVLPLVLPALPVALPRVPWWACAIPGGVLVAFLAVARWSVVSLQRTLDQRVDLIRSGWEDDTISFQVPAELRETSSDRDEVSVELSGPIALTGSLWDPIPVTTPTYVSKPLVPRTVRTIDLSAPGLVAPRIPVTNDTQAIESPINEATVNETTLNETMADETTIESDEGRPRAVGE